MGDASHSRATHVLDVSSQSSNILFTITIFVFPSLIWHRTSLSLVFKCISDTWNPILTSVWGVPRMTAAYSSVGDNCPTANTARRPMITHYHTGGLRPHRRQGAWEHAPLLARLFTGRRRARAFRQGGRALANDPCAVGRWREAERNLGHSAPSFYCRSPRARRSVRSCTETMRIEY